MARPDKEAAVQEITEILKTANGIFIADFQGLNVEKTQDLRRKCRESAVSFKVVKNTLAIRAAREAGYEDMVSYLEGPSALAYSYDDPSAPARIITEFAKTNERPVIKMSVFEGIFYGPDKIKTIAALPSRKELLGKLVSGFNAPLQGFAGSLKGLLQKMVYTLDAVREKREKEESK